MKRTERRIDMPNKTAKEIYLDAKHMDEVRERAMVRASTLGRFTKCLRSEDEIVHA